MASIADGFRDLLNVAFIGKMDAGKSSLCGALLARTGSIDARTVERLEAAGRAYRGCERPMHSWVMDGLKNERERGITINGNVKMMRWNKRSYTLLDAPGHYEFVKKSVRFIAQADVCVLCVDLYELAQLEARGEARRAFNRSSTVYRLAAQSYMFNVRRIIVAFTHVDVFATTDDCRAAYQRGCAIFQRMLGEIGFREKHIVGMVPLSYWHAVNVMETSGKGNVAFYDGPSLMQLLSAMGTPPRHKDGPPLILFSNAYRIGGIGTVVCGTVLRGTLRRGDELLIVPGLAIRTARSIEVARCPVDEAVAGLQVGIAMSNMTVHAFRKLGRGFLIGRCEGDGDDGDGGGAEEGKEVDDALRAEEARRTTKKYRWMMDARRCTYLHPDAVDLPLPALRRVWNLPSTCTSFVADCLILRNKMGKLLLQAGSSLSLITRILPGRVELAQVWARLDRTFSVVEPLPEGDIRVGTVYRLEFTSKKPLMVQPHEQFPMLSRFVLDSKHGIIAAGVCRSTAAHRINVSIGYVGTQAQHIERLGSKFNASIRAMRQLTSVDQLRGLNALVCDSSSRIADASLLTLFVDRGGSLLLRTDGLSPQMVSMLAELHITGSLRPVERRGYSYYGRRAPLMMPARRSQLVYQARLAAAEEEAEGGKAEEARPAAVAAHLRSVATYTKWEAGLRRSGRLSHSRRRAARYAYASRKAKSARRALQSRRHFLTARSTMWTKLFSGPVQTKAKHDRSKRLRKYALPEAVLDAGMPGAWLPDDVMVEIFSFLSGGAELATVAVVCHDWERASSCDALWKPLCEALGAAFVPRTPLSRRVPTLVPADAARRLARKSVWKCRAMADRRAPQLLEGECGRTCKYTRKAVNEEVLLDIGRDCAIVGRPELVLAERPVREGGGFLIIHAPRGLLGQRGQYLVGNGGYGEVWVRNFFAAAAHSTFFR
eukprot:PLAT5665.1.p1 GENE.PLAT5665.1~~PLAT5665.1.p1  ORF type:complete len:952 (+),score=407.34 PLAT5665.1:36-2858(+)